MKGTGGKQMCFFPNFAATYDFSRMPAPREDANVIKPEDTSELDSFLLEGVKKVPKLSIPTLLFSCQIFSKAHPSVEGKIWPCYVF